MVEVRSRRRRKNCLDSLSNHSLTLSMFSAAKKTILKVNVKVHNILHVIKCSRHKNRISIS